MQKDKILKISLIFAVLCVFSIFIVKAATNISLKCISDYGTFLSTTTTKDTIDGAYFNQNNLMVLNYQILDGFTQIKNSTLKVKLEGLENYDKDLVDSCIRLFYEGDYADSFQVSVNYMNYLNYSTENGVETASNLFPDRFKIVVYGEIDGEEIVVVEKNIQIETTIDTSKRTLILEPFDTNATAVTSNYSYIDSVYNEQSKIYELNYNLAVGSWEDEKCSVFDYYLFDNSAPRNDLKSISSTNAITYFSQDPLIGFSIEVTDEINGTVLEGNKKLVLKYDRPNKNNIDKRTYTYFVYFVDANGETITAKLNINFMQYERISYMAGISNPEIKNSAIVKERETQVKASEDGLLTLIFDTPTYQVTGFDILDKNFAKLDESHFDCSSTPSKLTSNLSGLETGWYTLLLYSESSDRPSNAYSFYFEKEAINSKTTMHLNGKSQILNSSQDVTIPLINSVGGWVMLDNVISIGNRELILNPYYSANTYSNNTYFDEKFAGALHINVKDTPEFDFDITKLGKDFETFHAIVTIVGDAGIDISFNSSESSILIPKAQGGQNYLTLNREFRKDNVIIDEDYSYEIYFKGEEILYDDIFIDKGIDSDTFKVNYGAEAGTYTVKIYLKNYESVSKSIDIVLKYDGDSEDIILKLLNDAKVAVPAKKGYKNIINLDGRILKGGSEINEEGVFELVSFESEGVSVNEKVLTILDNSTIGKTFTIKFSYGENSISKQFTLVAEDSSNNSGIVDGNGSSTSNVKSIVLKGFDSDKIDTKYLTFADTSGESKTISYTCYDADGKAIANPSVEISGSDIANGILVVPNYAKQTVTIYANGLYANRNFNLLFVSGTTEILNQAVIACKPNEWDCSIEFDKYYFTRNATFSATGNFSNFFDEEKNVSFVLVLYDKNNKIVKYDIDSATLKSGETKKFKAKFLMAADTTNITVKAFFIDGLNITDSSKIYTNSRTMTNKEELN